MHTIRLKAQDSRYATRDELNEAGITPDQIPTGWHAMAHQVKTIKAVNSGDAAMVVNMARTGDGKTFAGQFLLFAYRWKTLTMYPTKELAIDQKRSVEDMIKTWNPPSGAKRKLEYEVLDADKLDDLQEKLTHLSRPQALQTLLDNELTLTNPDIFHLMMQLGYSQYGAAKDLVLGDVVNRYRMFVFDEFHQFGAAQAASVMIAMLLMREITQGKQSPRFLFLSATPQGFLESMAEKLNLKVERIDGEYEHGMPAARAGWRRILQPVTLTLYPGRLEQWVAEHLDDVILRFFADHKNAAKGVIIANGVATAHRIYALLRGICEKARIKLGLNTGLTSPSERDRDADLLIATSTIDVGVDFKINLLIFESVDASSHIQRLGRLGRHEQDTDGHKFTAYEAHALLPPWVVDELTKQFPADSEVCRPDYIGKLGEVFVPFQQFEAYTKKWAGVQAANVLSGLRRPEIRTQYEPYTKRLTEQYKTLFPGGTRKFITLVDDKSTAILEEATSFRGGSPFTALVLDVENQRQVVTPYNLITLLINGDLESAEIEDFYKRAERQGKSVKALKRAKPLAAYVLRGWLPKPRTVEVYIDQEIRAEHFDIVRELDRVRLNAPDVPGLNALNSALEQRVLVAMLIKMDPEELRKRLRLGYQLEIFKFTSIDNEQEYSIVFGRDALLIDSVYWRKKSSNDDPIIA